MRLRGVVAIAAVIVGTMGVASGTAYADPGAASPEVVGYEMKVVDRSIVTTLDAGSFVVRADGGTVDLADAAGNPLLTLPLSFSLDGVAHPYLYDVSGDGRTLSLTPDMDPARSWPVAVTPVASLIENQRAQEAFATQFGIATALGGFTGTVIGLIVGCIIGAPLVTTIVGFLGACATGAAFGAVIGTIVAGGPALAIAGIDLINTLNAPPGTTKWNYPENVQVIPQ